MLSARHKLILTQWRNSVPSQHSSSNDRLRSPFTQTLRRTKPFRSLCEPDQPRTFHARDCSQVALRAANRFLTNPIVLYKGKIVFFAPQVSDFFCVAAQQTAHLARTERHRRRLAQGLPHVSNRERWPLRTTGKTECQSFYVARFTLLTRRNRSRQKSSAPDPAGTDGTGGGWKRGLRTGDWGLGRAVGINPKPVIRMQQRANG
jgi:hypothetical protein